jgi:translation initiation factor 1
MATGFGPSGKSDDPFNEGDDPTAGVISAPEFEVHIRIQQRNGKKCLTLVQGLPPKLSLKKVIKFFKKQFCCNGNIVDDTRAGQVLQLQGDQRKSVAEFLVDQQICRKEQVRIHGAL